MNGDRSRTSHGDAGGAQRSGGPLPGGPRSEASARAAILAIGGFDPSGGAGVVRDFLTGRTWGTAVRLIPTCWTEQSEVAVTAVEPRDPAALSQTIRDALDELAGAAGPPAQNPAGGAGDVGGPGQPGESGKVGKYGLAVKIGMLPDVRAASAVGAALRDFAGPVVFDPVLAASNGGALFSGPPSLLLPLCKQATLVTPNAAEATALTGVAVRTLGGAAEAGRALCARGARAVLVKGGHIDGDRLSVDVLVTSSVARELPGDRVPGPAVRGTGCALATAIAVGLGRGLPLIAAITEAKAWLSAALRGAIPVGRQWHLS